MFTGLIREVAKVVKFENNILTLKSSYKPKIGDSIAVNGVCLTVIAVNNDTFSVEVAPETASIVPKEKFLNEVHIEPAMAMGDRFEGHIVQGHVDTIGEVTKIEPLSNGVNYYIKVPKEYIKYIIPKGSITIDGVSLTVNDVYKDSFRLTIIPHTLQNTLIKNYKVGTKVNIETDMFARYIEHLLSHKESKSKGLSWEDIDAISMSY